MKRALIFTFLFIINISHAQIGIGTSTPGNTLEINSGTTDASGLRFTQLNSASTPISNTPAKVFGLNGTGDVVFTELYPQVVSASTTLDVNTPANTTLTLGELQIRTSKTTTGANGNLHIRSSSASTLAVTVLAHKELVAAANNFSVANITLNANSGAYTLVFAGGLNSNELQIYRITTAGGGIYQITLVNRSDVTIFIVGEKLK